MALTAAERARRYRERIKADPGKHKQYLKKEKARYRARKEGGKLKTIHDLTNEREKRQLRRCWKKNKQNQRKQKRQIIQANRLATINTPPQSPESDGDLPVRQSRSDAGKRRIRRDRSMAYRRIRQLEKALEEKTRLAEKYRQQSYRLKLNLKENSPRSKTESLLKGVKVPSRVKKALLLHNVITENIKMTYKTAKKHKVKQTVVKVIGGQILRKYKLLKATEKYTGIARKILRTKNDRQNKTKSNMFVNLKQCVHRFYNQDDVSRIKAGKKETVTRYKQKKQKRLLSDSLKNLHAVFLAQNPMMSISYSLFCRLRPFWVLIPTANDRDTCLCKIHANCQFMADKLFQLGAISTREIESLIESTRCNPEKKSCMYGECQICKNNKFPSLSYNPGLQTDWFQWKNRVQSPNDDRKTFKMTVKEQEFGTLQQLINDFQERRERLSKHIFNIRHQYKTLRYLRENLTENSAVLHIDFSENYSCKYAEEIQSVHFGASHQQVSLHTAVIYLPSASPISCCTFASTTRHDPAAIWAHLNPLISHLKSLNSNLEILHFVSDGPTTQYRCRTNFFLFSTLLYKYGMKAGTWNFLEAGHGKGPSDGIGSVIKRTADSIVSKGTRDLPNARTVYDALSNSNLDVKMWWISNEDIASMDTIIPNSIPPVPGTMGIHQVITHSVGEIFHREVSCFCGGGVFCECFNVSRVMMVADEAIKNDTLSDNNSADKVLNTCTSERVELTEQIVGKWCMVVYDGLPYPGIIQSVDDGEVEVTVMHRIGNNRFFWPMRPDILWYKGDQLLTLMPPTERVTNRHQMVKPEIWTSVMKTLNL